MAYGSNTIGGGLTGASTGATLGSVVPGIGTAVGAGIGGLLGAGGGLLEDIYGGAGKNKQLSTLRPEQQNLQNSLIQMIQQRLSGQGGLSPIGQNAVQRFNTQTVPGLAERFTALGSGAQGSSAFAGAVGSAGAGLQDQLAGMDWQQILQLLGPALSQSSENIMEAPGGLGTSSTQALPFLLKYLASSQGQQAAPQGMGQVGQPDIMSLIRNQLDVGLPSIQQRLGGVA